MAGHQSKGKEKLRSRDSTSIPGDVPEHQNHHAFWKIKDRKGWEHGIMVNANRQHWKCIHCSVTGRSGGVSGLKRHLVGAKNTKKCLAVPEDDSAQIKRLMENRKEKRQKRAALKKLNNVKSSSCSDDRRDKNDVLTPRSDVLIGVNTRVPEEGTNKTNAGLQKTAHEPAFFTGSEPWDLIPSTSHGLISDVTKDCSAILSESAQGSMVLAHVPGGTCYCYFCTLERAMERPEYQEMMLRSLHTKMVGVVDRMLSAAEELSG